ncbi:Putative ubiquitin-like protein Atg12 [Septoria linicola]|uniref:Ubiquitin-like protein ATG12 n=1 Tax=Septoria linicola TaxID=215465 RepID=A0A9Q9AFL8_9PEZI|nr:Putative ubiquitin-like protein Atg12 [Septoria linicola]
MSASPPEDASSDNGRADLQMTMAASVVLEHLPRDAAQALGTAGELEQAKVTIRLSPLPNTPQLKQPRFKCSSSQRFEHIVRFLRRKLALNDHESVFCYVNSVFAPGLDEGVGNLWRCFKTGDELVVSYSITQAFG